MNKTRERILDVSTRLFRQQGLVGTGIKQILDEADAPFGSLYHHFPGGKDELAAVTIERAGAEYAQLVTEALLAGPDLASNIKAAFLGAGETLVATDFADACPIETVALEVASTNERLRLATADVFESWIVGLTVLLEASGVMHEPAQELSYVIISALEGAFVLCRAQRTTTALEATGEAMATLVASAIGASDRRQDGRLVP